MRAQIAASSGRFALNREIPVCSGLRGGAGRTRTSNQTVIAETRVNQRSPHGFTGGEVAAALDARSSCVLTAVSDHSGLSANRAGLLNAQSCRLIIVWLRFRARAKAAGERGEATGRLEESVTFPPPHGDSTSYGAGLMLLRPTHARSC